MEGWKTVRWLTLGVGLLVLLAGVASASLLRPGVSTWDGKSKRPVITADPAGRLYLAWEDSRAGGATGIYFNRSEDGGATWQQEDLPVYPAKPPEARAGMAELAADGGGNVYVVWQLVNPSRLVTSGRGQKEIWFGASQDFGATWAGQAKRLPDEGHAFLPQIVADRKGRVAVVWYEELRKREAHGLFLSTSTDGGKRWSSARRMDVGEPAGLLSGQRLMTDGAGHLYLLWWETREKKPNVVAFLASEDFGATWPEQPSYLSPGNRDIMQPEFATDGKGHLFVVWADLRDGKPDIYVRVSPDHGKTWAPERRLDGDIPGGGFSFNPQISATEDGRVYVVWADSQNSNSPPGLYLAASTDSGHTWARRLLAPQPTDGTVRFPKLLSDRTGRVAITWMEEKKNHIRAFGLVTSRDRGTTWEAPTQKAVRTPTRDIGQIALALGSRDSLVIAWEERIPPPNPAVALIGKPTTDIVVERVPLAAKNP